MKLPPVPPNLQTLLLVQGQEDSQHCPSIVTQHKAVVAVVCLTSKQHPSVSQGWICSDTFMCCHTEIEVAEQTFYLTQSQYTDTEPTSANAYPITPGTWQGRHWSANFLVTGITWPRKILMA